MPLTVEPGSVQVIDWILKTGTAGPYSQQIHLFIGLGDVLIEHEIPVQGTFAKSK